MAPAVLSILLGELQGNGGKEQVEYMVVTYLALARNLGAGGEYPSVCGMT